MVVAQRLILENFLPIPDPESLPFYPSVLMLVVCARRFLSLSCVCAPLPLAARVLPGQLDPIPCAARGHGSSALILFNFFTLFEGYSASAISSGGLV